MEWYYIYKLTNPVTGESYIGSTKTTPEHRFQGHINKPSVGMSNTTKDERKKMILEVIDYGFFEHRMEALDLEDDYMLKYDTIINGYNTKFNRPHRVGTGLPCGHGFC